MLALEARQKPGTGKDGANLSEFDYYVLRIQDEHRRAGVAGELKRAARRAMTETQTGSRRLSAGLSVLAGLIVLTAAALVIYG